MIASWFCALGLLLAPRAAADLPIHCLHDDVVGTWEFTVGTSHEQRTSCGHGHPDDPMKEPLVAERNPWWSAKRLSAELSSGGTAKVGDEDGTWTMVSDEAVEVRYGDTELLAFFGFEPLPADNGGEHLPLMMQRRHSRCNETVLGWYSEGGRARWGCWYGRHAGSSFLQRRKRVLNLRGHIASALQLETNGQALARDTSAPKELDWRNASGHNWVDRALTQGICGGCYAIAAVQMLSARHRIAKGDASAEGFSAAFPLFCSEYTQGCAGGYPFLTSKWSQDVGLVPEACLPYAAEGQCRLNCDLKSLGPERRHRAAKHRYVSGGEDAIIKELASAGPLAVSFRSDPSLQEYSGGVWQPEPVEDDGAEQGFVVPTHAALLVGYGEDANNGPYWIIQNAWGPDWGEQGGFRIGREAARARGIEMLVVAADVVQEDRPAILEGLLARSSGQEQSVLLSMGSRTHVSTTGHRGRPLCRQPAASPGDQDILVRLDAEQNFRSLSFGDSAGTETAVQCVGQTPSGCVFPADGAPVPDCGAVEDCTCDLHGQDLPYPGMRSIAEKVVLMCSASVSPVRVLLIGLGGGAISSYLQDRCGDARLALESVEKDGRVAELAQKFFGYHTNVQNTVEVTDGMSAISSRSKGSYDAVIVDCFAGQDRVPLPCRSAQFYTGARSLLKHDGLLLQNVWARSSASSEVGNDFNAAVAALTGAFGQKPHQEVAFDAPQSLEYILYGVNGQRWLSVLPADDE